MEAVCGLHNGSSGLGFAFLAWYNIHMKRTNLMLNEELLEEATRLSGERTFSAAVNQALEHFVRRAKAGRILELAGRGLWEGDLSEMRGENRARSNKRKATRGTR